MGPDDLVFRHLFADILHDGVGDAPHRLLAVNLFLDEGVERAGVFLVHGCQVGHQHGFADTAEAHGGLAWPGVVVGDNSHDLAPRGCHFADQFAAPINPIKLHDFGRRYVLGAVHVEKVGGINRVLADFLHVGTDIPGMYLERAPFVIGRISFGDDFRLEVGRQSLGVIPHVDHLVQFTHRPGTYHLFAPGHFGRHLVGVGYIGALALAIVGPAVEGADDGVAHDRGAAAGLVANAVAQVGAHVGTVGIQHPGVTALGAKQDQVGIEIAQRHGCGHRQVMGVGHLEPAKRHGHWYSFAHGMCSLLFKGNEDGSLIVGQ